MLFTGYSRIKSGLSLEILRFPATWQEGVSSRDFHKKNTKGMSQFNPLALDMRWSFNYQLLTKIVKMIVSSLLSGEMLMGFRPLCICILPGMPALTKPYWISIN